MKITFGILVLLLAAPLTVYSHSEFIFPKLFSVEELQNTGFVLLNPGPYAATATFFFISANGSKLASTPPLPIGPGGQFTRLGSELFPGAASSGWVYAIDDTEGMQSFWLNYDAGITFLDGAESALLDTIGPDQIIPMVAGRAELNIVNPNGIRVPVTIHLFGDTGELGPAFSLELAVAGAFQGQVSALFPSVDPAQARYIRVRTLGAPIASSVLIRSFLVPFDTAVVNGANPALRAEITFPHVVNGNVGGSNYTSFIGVTNLGSISQTVTLTFHPEQGDPTSVQRQLAGNGALREAAQDLFGFAAGLRVGWVNVTGTSAITGFAAYAETTSGGLAVVPAADPQRDLFFMHIAEGLPQWQTGLALVNPTATPASVEIYALNPSGTLLGVASFTLDPGKKVANVIHELIPQTRGINGGFVYARTTNNVPLCGIELFYTEDLKVMSNVAAGRLVQGVTYTPPSLQGN